MVSPHSSPVPRQLCMRTVIITRHTDLEHEDVFPVSETLHRLSLETAAKVKKKNKPPNKKSYFFNIFQLFFHFHNKCVEVASDIRDEDDGTSRHAETDTNIVTTRTHHEHTGASKPIITTLFAFLRKLNDLCTGYGKHAQAAWRQSTTNATTHDTRYTRHDMPSAEPERR